MKQSSDIYICSNKVLFGVNLADLCCAFKAHVEMFSLVKHRLFLKFALHLIFALDYTQSSLFLKRSLRLICHHCWCLIRDCSQSSSLLFLSFPPPLRLSLFSLWFPLSSLLPPSPPVTSVSAASVYLLYLCHSSSSLPPPPLDMMVLYVSN